MSCFKKDRSLKPHRILKSEAKMACDDLVELTGDQKLQKLGGIENCA